MHIVISLKMLCVKYKEERVRLQQKVREAGRSWDLEGIRGDKVRETQRRLIEFLKDTGLFKRILYFSLHRSIN